MVNTQHIHTFLSSYIQYSKEDIATLENMAEKEPFFPMVNVALLKAYHQNNDKEKYEKLLPKVALMIPDRSVLKKHIEDIVIKEILKEEIKTIEFPQDRRTEILEENIEEETQDTFEQYPEVQEENEVAEPENILEEKVEEISNIIDENEVEETGNILEGNEVETPEILDENEVAEAGNILDENEVEAPEILDENEVEETGNILEEREVEVPEIVEENEVEEAGNILEEEQETQVVLEENKVENHEEIIEEEKEEDDFFAWLQHIKEDEPVKEEVEVVDAEKTVADDEIESEETVETDEEENIVTEEIIEDKRTQSEIDELLNKFIATNPSISRPKMNFYNPMDKAKESEEIKEDLASETLAKIYISQQLYDKAIVVWEQLKKMKPEKAGEFQKEIEAVKKLKKGK